MKHDVSTKHISVILCTSLLITMCVMTLLVIGCSNKVMICGKEIDRSAVSLDLRNTGIVDVKDLHGINQLHSLRALDLRGNPISEYSFLNIQKSIPRCEIRWSVPVDNTRIDSFTDVLALPNYSSDYSSLLDFFPYLKILDARGSNAYASLIDAVDMHPHVSFIWTVEIADSIFINTTESALCPEETSITDVLTMLAALPELKIVNLLKTNIYRNDIATLVEKYPNVSFRVKAQLYGQLFDSDSKLVSLSPQPAPLDCAALLSELLYFPQITELDLRKLPLTSDDFTVLNKNLPNITIIWSVSLLDTIVVDSNIHSLDLSGNKIEDLGILKKQLSYLPNLAYVDMCNCGVSDEEMAKMRTSMPTIKFVWMLHISFFEVRTDIKAFSLAQTNDFNGSNFTKKGDEIRRYRWINDEEISKLRYCTDIEALDIGHAYLVTDISFVKYLTKLRFLVISRTAVKDLSPISNLLDLVFLEFFSDDISDISVLSRLENLEYLNCSNNSIQDITPLIKLKSLKRLWAIHCSFSVEQINVLVESLPNTIVMTVGSHPTDSGWRYSNPRYLEMQELFGLEPQLSGVKPGW